MASYFGHSYLLLIDHRKALPYLRDSARLCGGGGNLRDFDAIDWFVRDMIGDRKAVAQDVVRLSKEAAQRMDAECVIMDCTIITAIDQEHLMEGGTPSEVPIVNPNSIALKVAEGLADLHSKGGYHLAQSGFYQKPTGHYLSEFQKARKVWDAARPDLATSPADASGSSRPK